MGLKDIVIMLNPLIIFLFVILIRMGVCIYYNVFLKVPVPEWIKAVF